MLSQFLRRLFLASVVVALCFVSPFILSLVSKLLNSTSGSGEVFAQDAATSAAPSEAASSGELPAPLTERSYAGTNQCFICHRPQTNTWSETKHAHAFTDVPERYRNDPACLTCHSTGFGKPGGYVSGTDKDLSMVGCESCHGPGAQHIDAAQRFVLATTDADAIEKEMRDTIVKTPTDSVCIKCHIMQAHQRHPAYDSQILPGAASRLVAPCMPAVPCGPWSTSAAAPVHYASKYSVKTCGGCHYDQYKQWSAGKHSDLFAVLPATYRNDQECQKCHPKGGAVAQSATVGTDPHHGLIGAACESCHGPALEHVLFTKQFISSPPLGPKLEQMARDAISKGKPASLCVQCHVGQRHQQHPQFDEK
jgi:Cytochrome c554 and c-prime